MGRTSSDMTCKPLPYRWLSEGKVKVKWRWSCVFQGKHWDRKNRADLIKSATPCHDAHAGYQAHSAWLFLLQIQRIAPLHHNTIRHMSHENDLDCVDIRWHILKTVKNVTDRPPVHTKTAHFETGRFWKWTSNQYIWKQHCVNTRKWWKRNSFSTFSKWAFSVASNSWRDCTN